MKLAGQIRLPTGVDADVLAGEDLTEIDLSAIEGRKLRPSSSVGLAQERIVALREQFHRRPRGSRVTIETEGRT